MIVGEIVCFALTAGISSVDSSSIVGQYRVAIILDTSTGFVGLPPNPLATLSIIPLSTDIGQDLIAIGASRAEPIVGGASPTGTPGTWCEPTIIARHTE